MRRISLVLFLFLVAGSVYPEDHTPAGAPTETQSAGFDLTPVLVHHLMDAPVIEVPPLVGRKVRPGDPAFEHDTTRRYVFKDSQGIYKWETPAYVPQMHITKRVAMMWLVALGLMAFFITGARIIARDVGRVQGRFASIVEVLVSYVRTDIAESNMHHPSPYLVAYILTAFFFILFSNLFGLFPPIGEIVELTVNIFGGHSIAHHAAAGELPSKYVLLWPGITVTGDVAVTMTFGLMTMILIWVAGFQYQGFKFLWHAVPGGVPLWLYPIMWPIEFIVGPLAKGVALTIRLLANMTAGHVIILAFAGFIFQFRSYFLVPVSMAGMGAIYLLEVGVAFLQAFVFTLLSAIFIGMSMHRH